MTSKTKHTPTQLAMAYGKAEGYDLMAGHSDDPLDRVAVVVFHDDHEGETKANARLLCAAWNSYVRLAEKLGVDAVALAESDALGRLYDAAKDAEPFTEDGSLAGYKTPDNRWINRLETAASLTAALTPSPKEADRGKD